jgi:branched-chain amino acid aminotransferase
MDLFNWAELTFAYYKTDFNVRCYYTNGKWGELEISDSDYMPIHIAATALHYGQQSFEGLKAYKGKDGRVRIFRWEDNAKRMQDSAQGILMAVPPIELFKKMIYEVVKLNIKFVPPYGTGSSLYY